MLVLLFSEAKTSLLFLSYILVNIIEPPFDMHTP